VRFPPPAAALRTMIELWPLWLSWFAWKFVAALWRDVLLGFPDHTTAAYALAYRSWPSAALVGPILLMVAAIVAQRLQFAGRLTSYAGVAGVAVATGTTALPQYQRLAPYIGRVSLLEMLEALDPGIMLAITVGLVAMVAGIGYIVQRTDGAKFRSRVVRGRSDNFGHADWLAIRDAQHLFPSPDASYGGIVVGEAYRVDQDSAARRAFISADKSAWGQGGTRPLLIDPCRTRISFSGVTSTRRNCLRVFCAGGTCGSHSISARRQAIRALPLSRKNSAPDVT
jgi:type IV secretion system protein VirD4